MDDMLEVAASEMRRRKRIASPSAAGSAEAAVGAGRGKDSEISVTSTTGSEEREDAGAEDREDPVAIVFLEELSRFRSGVVYKAAFLRGARFLPALPWFFVCV